MQRIDKKTAYVSIIVALLIILAIALRAMRYTDYSDCAGILRSFIYLGLFSAWGVSIRKRIMQVQVRRYMIVISVLMVFWVVVRTVKYDFIPAGISADVTRALWYLFYVPMLLIPLIAVFIAMSLGKSEDYVLPKWKWLFYIPTAVCLLLVMTNDFHQLVFTFPKDAAQWTDRDYSYAFAYFVVIIWEIACAVGAVVLMIFKCRMPRSRRMQSAPLITIGAACLYGVLYCLRVKWLYAVAGDMTVAFCLFFAAALESCIQSGLIRSNVGYREVFKHSSASVQITDENFHICFASDSAPELPVGVLRSSVDGTVTLDRNTLLKSHPISAGHVVWTEDVEQLADAIEILEDNRERLLQSNAVERENYNTRQQTSRLREQNRLYDLVQEQTAMQTKQLSQLLESYHQSTDKQEQRTLLARAAVLGAYIKRRGNLVLLGEKNTELSVRELSLSINESLQNLELLKVQCEQSLKLTGTLTVADTVCIYEYFETVTELALNGMTALWITASEKSGQITVHMDVITAADLSALRCGSVIRESDGSWGLTLCFGKGGAA